jgi:hypothetical protein
MAMRCMQLAFAPAGGQALTVTAPANIHIAQPGFYMLFAVSRDDTFSVGSWLRLKGPWGSRPSSLPTPAQFVNSASSQFEANFGEYRIMLTRPCRNNVIACVVCGQDKPHMQDWIETSQLANSNRATLPPPHAVLAFFAPCDTWVLHAVPWTVNPSGSADVALTRTAAAAGSGGFGLRVAAGGGQPIVLAGPALALTAG